MSFLRSYTACTAGRWISSAHPRNTIARTLCLSSSRTDPHAHTHCRTTFFALRTRPLLHTANRAAAVFLRTPRNTRARGGAALLYRALPHAPHQHALNVLLPITLHVHFAVLPNLRAPRCRTRISRITHRFAHYCCCTTVAEQIS